MTYLRNTGELVGRLYALQRRRKAFSPVRVIVQTPSKFLVTH